ncbi:MAG: translation elongation factor Ts [Bdellovibrionaceae bacterium]|nr:translation elongation factor Ts [Pseudobdellovibrionaceae bacterium]
MTISASAVKELREKTNAGMMDCKRALEETKGDMNAAIEWLRTKGLATAAKKAGRVAAEGLVAARASEKVAALIEVNSETDFVARNESFKAFVDRVLEHVLHTPENGAPLLEQKFHSEPSKTVGDALKEAIAKIGENIVIRRTQRYEASQSVLNTYVHGEGKIGVLLELAAAAPEALKKPEVKALAQDLCLHIAAMNPMAISGEQMPADVVAKEREILRAKNLEEGKKPEMVDKIVEGQIKKFLAQNCLLEQAFVKNPDQKVSDLLKEWGSRLGTTFTIKRYQRFELGEGIERKKEDFAAEVAAQVKGH